MAGPVWCDTTAAAVYNRSPACCHTSRTRCTANTVATRTVVPFPAAPRGALGQRARSPAGTLAWSSQTHSIPECSGTCWEPHIVHRGGKSVAHPTRGFCEPVPLQQTVPVRTQRTWSHTGWRHAGPCHRSGHVHTSGAVQFPPFPHVMTHTGVVQFGSNQPESQMQVSGCWHNPCAPQSCTHMGRSHRAPVYPGLHVHSPGAVHTRLLCQVLHVKRTV